MTDRSPEPSAENEEQQQSSSSSASRPYAAFRLPPFSADDMGLWLAQVDCACRVAGIKDDEVKFDLVAANLPQSVALQVRDVVTAKPRSYKSLTSALQDRLAQNRTARLTSLLRHQQLGDQQPSQLLRNMRTELGRAGDGQQDVELLRMLFLQRLPPSVRAALSLLSEDTPLDQLATAADRYLDASAVAAGPLGVAAVTASAPPSPAAAAAAAAVPAVATSAQEGVLTAMQGMIASLTAAVSRLESAVTSQDHRAPRHGSPRRGSECTCGHRDSSGQGRARAGRSRFQSRGQHRETQDGLCYYHARFGEDAHRCRPPCTWQGNALA